MSLQEIMNVMPNGHGKVEFIDNLSKKELNILLNHLIDRNEGLNLYWRDVKNICIDSIANRRNNVINKIIR